MIVDIHTRVWQSTEQLGNVAHELRRRRPEPWDRPDASAESHREAVDQVDAAIVLGLRIERMHAHIPGHFVADYVKGAGDRLLGFAGIDPAAGNPAKQVEEALDLGLVGVVVNPTAQGYHPAATAMMAVYEACAAKRVPVLVDNRGTLVREAMMEFAQPALFDEALREFDGLRLIFGSAGGAFVEQCLALMMKHEHVYADLADQLSRPWVLCDALLRAHQTGALDRLLFGSGFPYAMPQQAMVAMYSAAALTKGTQLPAVPREQVRSIVERDTLAILGLAEKLKVRRDPPPPRRYPESERPANGASQPEEQSA